MKIDRTKNAVRNTMYGMGIKIYGILIPFLMRSLMIYCLGTEYLGLNSLFSSFLSVLNLAELGVGSAMVFSMYEPIAYDNEDKICALMKMYKTYYRIIGIIILFIGIAAIPFLPYLIHGKVEADVNIYIIYLMNLAATVLSYWMFAYKNSIITAHQRNDIIDKVTAITNVILNLSQILILIFVKNYYFFILASIIVQIINNIVIAVVANKMYPRYKPKGKLSAEDTKEINKRIRDLFTSKLGAVIVGSADTLVISAFLGLTVLAKYQNYYCILNAVIGVVTIVFGACTAGIGNSLIVESNEKNFYDLRKFTMIIIWITSICVPCFLNLYQPFMKLWMGEDLLLEYSIVICLGIYYFIYEVNALLNLYKDAGGIWNKDRFRPLVTGMVNLGLNLIMVQFWGLYGIIFSTVLSMLFVGMPWLLQNLFTTMFPKNNIKQYLKDMAVYALFVAFVSTISCFICLFIDFDPILTIIIRLAICGIVPNIFVILVFRKSAVFKDTIEILDRATGSKFRFVTKYLL